MVDRVCTFENVESLDYVCSMSIVKVGNFNSFSVQLYGNPFVSGGLPAAELAQ